MSGEKRIFVSVEEQELRRLREQDSRLRQLRNDLPERLNAVRQQAQQEMQTRLAPIEDRQRRHESLIHGLESELADLETQTARRFEHQHREFSSALSRQRSEYLDLIEDQDRHFTGMLVQQDRKLTGMITEERNARIIAVDTLHQRVDAEREARRRAMEFLQEQIAEEQLARQIAVSRLQGQIDAIVADSARKNEIAASFVADLNKILTETDKMPHRRFAPGQFDQIRRHVADAQRSLNAGMADAALSTAQNAYWQTVDLRTLVAQAEREFMLLHQSALTEARALLAEARARRQFKLETGQDTDRSEIDMEVDYWTQGELTAHEARLQSFEKQLLQAEKQLSIEDVKAIIAELKGLTSRTVEIIEQARQQVLASQLRANIADLAAETLLKEGFTVQGAAYEGDDARNRYVIKLANIAQDEVVAVISPMEGQFGKNSVSIHSYEKSLVDETARRQRAQEIARLFQEEGLETGNPEVMGEAKPEFQDLNQVRRGLAENRRARSTP